MVISEKCVKKGLNGFYILLSMRERYIKSRGCEGEISARNLAIMPESGNYCNMEWDK